ncbi:sulfite exporter TauE/SafE family protein [Siminovitchia sp. 179-K 8D1 HS]|uniref:sulfite exporter TauE/SafE family protein n=1 Tax=Siminovitchia sp. 179-K 8D1 HS TaxID=3142385 RepID=UPI0039A268E3
MLAFLIGLFSGVISGMVSVGGSIIVTSMLILFSTLYGWDLNMKQIVVFFGIPAVISSLASSLLANSIGDAWLQGVFAFFCLLAALAIILPDRRQHHHDNASFPYFTSIFLSLIVGGVGGLIGVAAGFLYMPIFLRLFHLTVRQAVGTGMVVGGMLCVGTIMGKLGGDFIRMDVILPLGISGVIGVLIGGKLTSFIKEKWLNLLMCIIIAAIAVQTIFVFLADSLMIAFPIVITAALLLSVVFLWLIFALNPSFAKRGERS